MHWRKFPVKARKAPPDQVNFGFEHTLTMKQKGHVMRLVLLAMPVAFALGVASPQPAGAVGCISGAVAGGVAGHYAAHHGLLGAAAGCAVGHHMHKVQREREREEAARQHAYDSPDYRGDTRPSDQMRDQNTGEYPR